MSISQVIADYVSYAIEAGGWMEMDRLYLQNQLASLIGVQQLESVTAHNPSPEIKGLVDAMISEAKENKIIHSDKSETILREKIYDFVTPPTSVLNALFAQRYNQDKVEATDYFHFISTQNQAIKEAVNLRLLETSQGVFCRSQTSGTEEKNIPTAHNGYPHCGLCFTNEGIEGNETFRYIRMNLRGESFGFRYAPYPLWHEHALFVSEEERYQMMNPQTVDHLLQIATIFPQYFVAAEMDQLPEKERPQHVVYQGGSENLPLFERTAKATFQLKNYPQIAAEVLDYPLTVCRFTSDDEMALKTFISQVIQTWRIYQEDDLKAFNEDGSLNHALDLLVRMKNDQFEVYVFFRQVTGEKPRLAQVLGISPVKTDDERQIEKLVQLLLASDPFAGDQVKIDHWMAKMNTLGE